MVNPRQKPHVLLVEDDPAIARMYRLALTEYGYRVETVPDGEAGLEAVHDRRPDLVLLDLRLPRMDGMQVLEHLRDDIKKRGLKVIVLSNHGVDETVGATLKLGAVEYLTKATVTPRELAQVIARHLVGRMS